MTDRLAFLIIWIGCLLAGLIAISWLLLAGLVNPHSPQTRKLAISFDQTANAVFGGSEDETISSRAERERAKGATWACWLCRLLDVIEPNHCEKSAGV